MQRSLPKVEEGVSQSDLATFLSKLRILISLSKTAKKNKLSLSSHAFYSQKARHALAELKIAEGNLSVACSGLESIAVAESFHKITIELKEAYSLFPTYLHYLKHLEEAKVIAESEFRVALASANLLGKPIIKIREEFIAEELLNDHEQIIKEILHEINLCYEYDCFNGCAVLIRRLVESLIILAFDVHGIADQIRDVAGNNLGLELLIAKATQSRELSLTRNTKVGLPKPKFYGDLAAHNPRARVRKTDLDKFQAEIRVVIEELGGLSSPSKRAHLRSAT